MDARRLQGLGLAAASGVLYGSINVLAKPIDMHPLLKGAIAYLVSATFLSPALLGFRVARADWPKVLVMGLFGGALAPLLLFYGLREATAADAGLLLTLELVATACLAMLFLGERFAGREWIGLSSLLLAALLVGFASREGTGESAMRGVLLVAGSAVVWGVDNTVSARLVGSYRPAGLIALKGYLGGSAALLAVAVVRPDAPAWAEIGAMAGIGVVSIAVSSLCFYFALKAVGASRTSAMNVATTALVGAFGGALLLEERLRVLHGVALAAVILGATLLARHESRGEPPVVLETPG